MCLMFARRVSSGFASRDESVAHWTKKTLINGLMALRVDYCNSALGRLYKSTYTYLLATMIINGEKKD